MSSSDVLFLLAQLLFESISNVVSRFICEAVFDMRVLSLWKRRMDEWAYVKLQLTQSSFALFILQFTFVNVVSTTCGEEAL